MFLDTSIRKSEEWSNVYNISVIIWFPYGNLRKNINIGRRFFFFFLGGGTLLPSLLSFLPSFFGSNSVLFLLSEVVTTQRCSFSSVNSVSEPWLFRDKIVAETETRSNQAPGESPCLQWQGTDNPNSERGRKMHLTEKREVGKNPGGGGGGGGGGTQIWFRRGCAAEAAKPVPIFKGHFGGEGYPLLRVF